MNELLAILAGAALAVSALVLFIRVKNAWRSVGILIRERWQRRRAGDNAVQSAV